MGGAEKYPVFMAVADKVGFDRRGNKLHKRTPDGEEIFVPVEKVEDNDLPVIAEKYREFLKEHDK